MHEPGASVTTTCLFVAATLVFVAGACTASASMEVGSAARGITAAWANFVARGSDSAQWNAGKPLVLEEYADPGLIPAPSLSAVNPPPSLRASGETVAVTATTGDDVVHVGRGAKRTLTLTINGVASTLTAAQAARLVILLLDGDDVMTTEPSVTTALTVDAGAGDDVVITGAGSDSVAGDPGADQLRTRGGDDVADAGDGDDLVTAGEGDDVLAGAAGLDHLRGEEGRDYLEGGADRDVLDGGRGDDVAYGLGGDDHLLGGFGPDYLDGGPGADVVNGQADRDMLFGGDGDDRLYGIAGDDLLVCGPGIDTYFAGAASAVHAQVDDRQGGGAAEDVLVVDLGTVNDAGGVPGSSLTVVDEPGGFAARVASDIDALRSVTQGRSMLTALDDAAASATVKWSAYGNASSAASWEAALLQPDGSPGPGSDAGIFYDPSRVTLSVGAEDWMRRPPIVGLYHELAHALNVTTGTLQFGRDVFSGVPNLELQAVGLPNSGIPFDNDGDPATPPSPDNLPAFTENGLRALLGIPLRPYYVAPSPPAPGP